LSLFPSSASTGQIFTTSASVNYRYNGEAWIFIPSSRGIFTVTSTTRPVNPDEGFVIYETDTNQVLVYDGTAFVEISGGGGGTVLFQDSQPDVSELETGALWIDSNENVGTGLDIQTFLRWSKTLSASTSTISGYDDNTNNLLYTPGFELVYINGTLINRGIDYTATSGNTVALTESAFSGDLIEIHAFESFILSDMYTKNETDNRYILNTASTLFLLNSASSSFEPNIAYVSASPSTPTAGTLWIDSSASATPSLKVYNGSTWIAVSGAVSESSEAGLHPFFQAGI
jgi:hypothetical protein